MSAVFVSVVSVVTLPSHSATIVLLAMVLMQQHDIGGINDFASVMHVFRLDAPMTSYSFFCLWLTSFFKENLSPWSPSSQLDYVDLPKLSKDEKARYKEGGE
jgi:hypothetical protein